MLIMKSVPWYVLHFGGSNNLRANLPLLKTCGSGSPPLQNKGAHLCASITGPAFGLLGCGVSMCIRFHIREQIQSHIFECGATCLPLCFARSGISILQVWTTNHRCCDWLFEHGGVGESVSGGWCDYIRFLYAIRERTDFYYKLQKLCDLSSEVGWHSLLPCWKLVRHFSRAMILGIACCHAAHDLVCKPHVRNSWFAQFISFPLDLWWWFILEWQHQASGIHRSIQDTLAEVENFYDFFHILWPFKG